MKFASRRENRIGVIRFDYIVIDIICMIASELIAFFLRVDVVGLIRLREDYTSLYMIMVFFIVCIDLYYDAIEKTSRRNVIVELRNLLIRATMVLFGAIAYIFVSHSYEKYSRVVIGCSLLFFCGISFIVRRIYRKIARRRMMDQIGNTLLVVGDSMHIEELLDHIRTNNSQSYNIVGTVVTDYEMEGEIIGSTPVVSNLDSLNEYLENNHVDEILLDITGRFFVTHELIETLLGMDIVVNLSIYGEDIVGNVCDSRIGLIGNIPIIKKRRKSIR